MRSRGEAVSVGVIHRSRYPMPEVPDTDSAGFVLEKSRSRGSHPALVDGVSGETVAYSQLPDAVSTAASALVAHGLRPGDAVALMAPNQPAWAVTFYGILTAGAALVPINPVLTEDEVVKLVELSGASLLIHDGTGADKAALVSKRTGATAVGLEQLSEQHSGWAPAEVNPDSTAVIAFSSGTTGQPKGVVLTHRNLVANICQHRDIYPLGEDDTCVAALPFFHIYGLSIILNSSLRHGATVVTLPRFELGRYLDVIASHRVTWLHVVPPIVRQLVSESAAAADLSSVRHAVSGAAPLDGALAAMARERLGTPVGQGYGMTEASPGVTWTPFDGLVPCPPGSVGVLVGGTEARLVDPATGADTEGPGEMWVRGPQVMRGYLGDESATESTIVEDGWLRTGDIMRVDEHGVWWVVDRLKEMIKYKGYQVAPAELEALISGHPQVIDVAVAGVPDEEAGEIPKAWVVARGDLTEAVLAEWVAARVAPYKKIRAVTFVEAIPRSPSGKVLRRQLRYG
ncbi:MAG TPA: AMP-binding protein [Acidimicrobiales bacterium]|nr:AMP-binding protein [Acidimicrobiales bacterium]